MDQTFSTIPVSTLRGDIKIPFDVYVMIRGKHVHYLRKGDSFEGERLTRLKEKRLKKVFILSEDKTHYSTYVSQSLDIAYDANSKRDLTVRAEIIQGAQESQAEAVLEEPSNPLYYQHAKVGTERYVEFLMNHEKSLKAMLLIQNLDGNLAHHGVNVSCIAVRLAQKIGFTEPKSLTIMSLGALVHDLGHVGQELDINRPLSHLAPSERKTYEEHPRVGSLKALTYKHFDPMVGRIIQEHEEFCNGTGFPKNLVQSQIARECQMVGLANQFDRLLTFEKRPLADALRTLLLDRVGCYQEADLNALRLTLLEQGVVT